MTKVEDEHFLIHRFHLLVNGNWGSWTDFGACDSNNMKNRTRSCDDRPSQYGGLDCLKSGTNDTYVKEEMDIVKCKDICPSMYIDQ